MPIYPQRCLECKHEWDDQRSMAQIEPNPKCPKCKGSSERFIAQGHGGSHEFPAGLWHDIDVDPVYIGSRRELNEKCKELNVAASGYMYD